MANLQAFKLLYVTMLLIGLSINDAMIKVSFAVNIKEEKDRNKKAAFKKILMLGFLEYLIKKSYSQVLLKSSYDFLKDECKEIDDDLAKKFEPSSLTNYNKAIKDLKAALTEKQTYDFFVKINFEGKETIDSKIFMQETKNLKLTSINFDVKPKKQMSIGMETFEAIADDSLLYMNLRDGFNYEETFLGPKHKFEIMQECVSISLTLTALNDIKPVFGRSKLLVV